MSDDKLLAAALAYAVDGGLERIKLWQQWLPEVKDNLAKAGIKLQARAVEVPQEEDPFA